MQAFADRSAQLLAHAVAVLGGKQYGPRSRDGQVDCVVAVAEIIRRLYPAAAVDGHWSDLMIQDHNRPWSDIDALVRMGVAVAVEAPVPGNWHAVQYWRGLESGRVVRGSKGHALLWYQPASPLAADGVVVEANVKTPWAYPTRWDRRIGDAEWRCCRLV